MTDVMSGPDGPGQYGPRYIKCEECGVSRPSEHVEQIRVTADGFEIENKWACRDRKWCREAERLLIKQEVDLGRYDLDPRG